MNCHEDAEPGSARRTDDVDLDGLIRSITGQFAIVFGKLERVAECCSRLERTLSVPPSPFHVERLSSLLPVLTEHSGPLVFPVYDLIERVAASCSNPWPLLKGMIAAREKVLVQRSLQCALRCTERGSLTVDLEVVGCLADLQDLPGTSVGDPECLPLVGSVVRRLKLPGPSQSADPVRELFLAARDEKVRRLAALILDSPGMPISADLAERTLGEEAFAFLAPYLIYSRASHADVLSLLPAPGIPPPALPSLRRAHSAIGENLLRHIIAEVGWPQINLGLDVRHFVRVSSGDSLPLILHAAEARLVGRGGELRQSTDLVVATAHGGRVAEKGRADAGFDPASRFRNYNLAHADVLTDFLAVAPLTAERTLSILERMGKIVGEYIGLFSSVSEECAILGGVYDGLRREILAGLEAHPVDGPLPPDLTRLTVMFEDPRSLGEVRTLHGLKRYLHQKGLRLGFKLVQRTLSTNRTVALLLCSRKRILRKVEGIRYADFEPESDGLSSAIRIPFSVALVADGFARQLLYGHESFPRVDIFCYGSEIHYYLAYGSHPAFLRINYSPPLQGGMIDLEYYGVSKYELSAHPDFSLHALQLFFRALGFHVHVEDTRVHARYDKEHTPDLRSLCERAAEMFRLAPYLLDIDWTIGGLDLDVEARRKVAAAWAESFAVWGVLPLRLLLTKNRQGVVERIVDTPAGRRAVAWNGTGPYRDAFRAGTGEIVRRLVAAAGRLLPEISETPPASGRDWLGQLQLERSLLTPLREALARGELTESRGAYERTSADLFHRMSEPELFAELVSEGGERLDAAASLAYLIGPLERFLSFRTAGTVGPYDVQSARLSLPDEDLGVHVMRGEKHNACLAIYTHGTVLYRRRNAPAAPSECNAAFDVAEFMALLRRTNYPVPGLEQLPPGLPEEVSRVRDNLARAIPVEPRRPIPGERTLAGLRATPGRAVGRVLLGTAGRDPEDFAGAVLVTPALQPHDGALLSCAAGVVSTGGGILSHAALLAAQFRKPAIIVAGQWESNPDRATTLRFAGTAYELDEGEFHGVRITTRKQIRERADVLHEGDLVVIDQNEDVLRVLGHDPDTLALHEELHQFGRASRELSRATTDRDRLVYRGRRIRARHQIEKILTRLVDPILTCHAIDELLQQSGGLGLSVTAGERGQLLSLVLNNPRVAPTATSHLRRVVHELRRYCEQALAEARRRIPDACSIFEVLNLRLDALRALQSLGEVGSCLSQCGIEDVTGGPSQASDIDQLVERRLAELREGIARSLEAIGRRVGDARCRHLLRQWEKTEALVSASESERTALVDLRVRLSESDAKAVRDMSARTILWPADGGFELFDLIGWKAANLAEIERIAGGSLVPPWFVVTDRAFRQILESPRELVFPKGAELPDGAPSLGKAIEVILRRSSLDRYQKSSLIRSLWSSVVLPESLAGDVLAAYRKIGGPDLLVALRSSSREEDAEVAARAGEFDTFLFIQGEQSLLQYLLRTWSGLWSDRALHTREMLGTTTSFAGGGVLVQQIVNSRVSGVLQTVNVARDDFREIVINAGWGLGEGVVSGTVAADQITVSKEENLERGPLRFSYVTADKREYVVFNKRAGLGTIRCEAPYHKRLRPTLEYSELCDLVAVAARLEASYGYPLDIEFALEGSRLWILQVRPVPTSHSLLQETLQHYPLSHAGEDLRAIPGEERHD